MNQLGNIDIHVTCMKNTNKRRDTDNSVFQNIIKLNDFDDDEN